MWYCRNCNEENEDGFENCWKCGFATDGRPPENPDDFDKQLNEVDDDYLGPGTPLEDDTHYGSARTITKIVPFLDGLSLYSVHLSYSQLLLNFFSQDMVLNGSGWCLQSQPSQVDCF